ncbi:MAG: response regulator [Bradyrhizobium sp.]|uniref:response regulator n=1 Tax=Bradyrhizobium sp. TaxID=376 RepID=UPI001D8C8E34|nr:response regulator [Bradyrhizobium sp.]MBV9563093.1 response regulator [Bradyrhizobium sp.]
MSEHYPGAVAADSGKVEKREPSLAGRRVLIVEDEFLVAALIEDILLDNGCEVVAMVSRLDQALEKAQSLSIDVAIVDVNLNGEHSIPVAETLARRGVPFVLATGYGASGLPKSFPRAPVLPKPFQQKDLERAIHRALGAP